MNKKTYTLATIFCLLLVMFTACGDDDDTDDYSAWKERNEKIFNNADAKYKSIINSQSGNGFIRFNEVDAANSNLKMTQDGTIQFSDSVTVVYEGWYILEDGSKYIFDSTVNNNNVPITSAVSNSSVFTDGQTTMLQYMKEGEEVEMCIPQKIAYGASGLTNSTAGYYVVPPYTTVFFNMKVIKVIPCNPNEFN